MADERNQQRLPDTTRRKISKAFIDHAWVVGVPLYKSGDYWVFDDAEGPLDISDFILYEREIALRPDVAYEVKQLVRNIIKAQMETKRIIKRMIGH